MNIINEDYRKRIAIAEVQLKEYGMNLKTINRVNIRMSYENRKLQDEANEIDILDSSFDMVKSSLIN